MKNKIILFALFIVLSVSMIACNSTKLVSSWKSPNASINDYKKVLVIGLMGSKDAELRASAEQRLVAAFKKKGINASSAYEEYGPKAFDNLNERATLQKINKAGYDGAFTIALLNKSNEKNYNPARVRYRPAGTYYNRFYRQFQTVYTQIYEPGYYTTSTNYVLDANFYDLSKDKLQYSAQTKSFDPGSASSLAADLSETLVEDMMAKGVVVK